MSYNMRMPEEGIDACMIKKRKSVWTEILKRFFEKSNFTNILVSQELSWGEKYESKTIRQVYEHKEVILKYSELRNTLWIPKHKTEKYLAL